MEIQHSSIENRIIPRRFLQYLPRRDTRIIECCKDKRVLHIGASDWPFTRKKFQDGNLLYARIGEVATEQLGIDQDEDASSFLNAENIPHSRIIVGDMNELQALDFVPDVIVFGETLEHLMNLERALSTVKELMRDDAVLIISVPNAFFFMNFVYALFRKEHQHPDHSVAFTYKTLTQLLSKVGFVVSEFSFTYLESSSNLSSLNWKGKLMYILVRMMTRISPVYAETLMVVAKTK